jgi:hypothetical protein
MKVIWTKHSEKKLKEYQLSKSRILRIIKNPYRIEEGIAPNTIALMRPTKIKNSTKSLYSPRRSAFSPRESASSLHKSTFSPRQSASNKTWKQEIWTMIQKSKDGIKIISAWRYPGKSPKQNPIPNYILEELISEGLI